MCPSDPRSAVVLGFSFSLGEVPDHVLTRLGEGYDGKCLVIVHSPKMPEEGSLDLSP